MGTMNLKRLCQSRYWWTVMLVGIMMIVCGMVYWLLPVQGYIVAAILFGWMLIGTGVVQLVISTGKNRPKGWGWWLIGGILNIFIGFMLVDRVELAELMLPYFLAIIFIYWGVMYIIESILLRPYKYWWIKLLNGLLMMFIGFFFIGAGYLEDMVMVSTLVALAFIYWGITLVSTSFELKPVKEFT